MTKKSTTGKKDEKLKFEFDFFNTEWSLFKHVILNGLPSGAIKEDWNQNKLDIKMTVNGVELDVEKTWKNIENQLDADIEEKAEELIKAKLGDKFSDAVTEVDIAVDNLVRRFRHMVEKTQPDQGTDYPETHKQGMISIEKNMKMGGDFGDFGIQIAKDGRVWVCVDGTALIRFKPTRKPKSL